VHVGLGMVAAQMGKGDESKAEFLEALTGYATAQLPAAGVTPTIKDRWDDAQRAWALSNPAADDATKGGWKDKAALALATQGYNAALAGALQECIEKDKAALALEDNARARLHLSGCEQKAGKVIDSLRDAQAALQAGQKGNDQAVVKTASDRLTALLPHVAHVGFDIPQGISDLKVIFDDRAVPPDRFAQKFSIDPGRHHCHAEGGVRGVVMSFDQDYDVKDGETVIVAIRLKPTALTPGQLDCMLAAKTQDDIAKCLPQDKKPLIVRAGLSIGGYTDSTSVHVLTPAIGGSVSSPTGGWDVEGSYLIDIVTAASPDIVSEASRHFRDVRHAGTLGGGFKPGRFGGHVDGFLSSEFDYFSRGLGVTLLGDFLDRQLTPSIHYSHSIDTIGRTGTPFSVFSNTLLTDELQLGATLVLTRSSILVFGGTAALERGDQSKPYRYIPMFDSGVSVPVGASISFVNHNRLPERPLEQLPLSRDRYAIAARYALRTGRRTLRLEERIYTDTWAINATTTDMQYIIDINQRLRVWPHLRFHAQTGAAFYQRVYITTLSPESLPAWRTTDRELSPFFSVTAGGGARMSLVPPSSKIQYGLSLQGDAMGSDYFNALFIRSRLALFGTLGFDAEFE
jgi:hypothetical protein